LREDCTDEAYAPDATWRKPSRTARAARDAGIALLSRRILIDAAAAARGDAPRRSRPSSPEAAMKKLKLDVETLAVESFDAGPERSARAAP
jgi:hypothetical protein